VRYVAVGGGSYHWIARDRDGGRWFATVDDLDDKPWLGFARDAVLDGLRAAMDTALALRRHAGLRFVAAPVPALGGESVRPLGSRYAVAVFGFLEGATGRFGEVLPAGQRLELADMLAALHQATPALTRPPVARIALPLRGALDAVLADLSQPWPGSPYGEPARVLLIRTADQLRPLLARFDQLAERVAARKPVITHGEPHPANVIRAGSRAMLIDWDTTGLAPPERDLWWIADGDSDGLRRYAAATGRDVDPAALAFYRLRWALDDISSFVTRLRSARQRTADGEHAWRALQDTIAGASLGALRHQEAGLADVRAHLGDQGVDGVEAFVAAEPYGKVDVGVSAVQVQVVTVQRVRLDGPLSLAERRVGADGDRGRPAGGLGSVQVQAAQPAGVDAVGRDRGARRALQVGGRESQRPAAQVTADDHAFHAVRPAEGGAGTLDVPGGQPLPDVRRGDRHAVHDQQRYALGGEVVFLAELGEQRNVACRTVPEAEVLPDHDGVRAQPLE
jgi:spectinomycin phosphotransferase